MRSRREIYTEETVAALLARAREAFGREGYEATSLEMIARQAQVTTGAIYHHFAGKKGLFQAVAERIEAELLAIALGVTDPDPWRGFKRAFEVLIDASAKPDVQRIIFLDAPRVIGAEAWRNIEMKYAYGAMSAALTGFRAAGLVRPCSVELLAPVLLAVLAETSRAVARTPGARSEALALMGRVIDSLRSDGGAAPASNIAPL
jgi:AcrR family transcriptional regulator